MKLPDVSKPTPGWMPPILYDLFTQSTKEEVICSAYMRPVPPETCGRDCQAYKPWRGNA